jgi:CheY-like chemotaxis protein/anti-sigma regulatory factor (Ser/Thr protein kinase)
VSRRVLTVDDEASLRLVIRATLLAGKAGYSVDEAADGLEALENVRTNSYDLLLADILMPRMDGIELLGVLRKEYPALPVVVLTAVGDGQCILSCLAEGAWDYVLKPFDSGQLRAAVRRALVASERLEHKPGDFKVTSSASGQLELTAASKLEYVHRFRRFTEILLRARLSPTLREDIRLAVEEIGLNAVEWGNRNERGKRVHLSYQPHEDRITFRVEDEGSGFLPDSLPDPSVDPVAHIEQRRREGKRAGGFGIHVVRKLMDEVRFSPKGNAVVMTKHLSMTRAG